MKDDNTNWWVRLAIAFVVITPIYALGYVLTETWSSGSYWTGFLAGVTAMFALQVYREYKIVKKFWN